MTGGIVIIGAGHCGVSAAMGARDSGFERPITIIGDEQVLPYERPSLSKWETGGPIERAIFPPASYVERDITLRLGARVTAINRKTSTLNLESGETLEYDRLLIATGAMARRIDPTIWPDVNLRYLRSLLDAQALSADIQTGAQVVIIGGGFIGLELAAALSSKQAHVHVIETQDRLLAALFQPRFRIK